MQDASSKIRSTLPHPILPIHLPTSTLPTLGTALGKAELNLCDRKKSRFFFDDGFFSLFLFSLLLVLDRLVLVVVGGSGLCVFLSVLFILSVSLLVRHLRAPSQKREMSWKEGVLRPPLECIVEYLSI